MTDTKKPIGRPTLYTPELASTICEQIALGYSMRSVCKAEGMPAMSAVFRWLRDNKEFQEQYARACEERTEAMAEDLLDIADDGTNDYHETDDGRTIYNGDAIQRSKLRVDTRKWLMAKMKPKKYGDKVDFTTDGKALPSPIYGGLSIQNPDDDINSDGK